MYFGRITISKKPLKKMRMKWKPSTLICFVIASFLMAFASIHVIMVFKQQKALKTFTFLHVLNSIPSSIFFFSLIWHKPRELCNNLLYLLGIWGDRGRNIGEENWTILLPHIGNRERLEYHRTHVIDHDGKGNIRMRKALPHEERQPPTDPIIRSRKTQTCSLRCQDEECRRPNTPN